jgi:hypothetical protein
MFLVGHLCRKIVVLCVINLYCDLILCADG